MKSSLVCVLAGFFLAIGLGVSSIWLWRFEVLNHFSNLYGQQVIGDTKFLVHDAIIRQDGKEVGTLKAGTRLTHRIRTESLEEFYLPLGWENNGRTSQEFGRAASTDRAFSILEIK